MIIQIYKETFYDFTTKDEIENTVFEHPILIEFFNESAFTDWRKTKEHQYCQKYNEKLNLQGDDAHKVHVHFAYRRLL